MKPRDSKNSFKRKKNTNEGFAKKQFGQNFLQNAQVRQKMLDIAGEPFPENVLEIGPGLGFMTCKLVKKAKHFTAIDLDSRVIPLLRADYGHHDHFTLLNENFLDFDLDQYYEQNKYSVIANIPYNITNPIFRKCLERTQNKPEQMVLMVQKEVGQKVCPLQDGVLRKKFKRSILSISVEVFATAEYVQTVPRIDFSPAPKVDSAVIQLKTRPEPLIPVAQQRMFFTVVNAAFSQKRKKLKNTLPGFFGVSEKTLFGRHNFDTEQRPEDLSIEDFRILQMMVEQVL